MLLQTIAGVVQGLACAGLVQLAGAGGSLQCSRLSAVQERERALRLWLLQMHLHSAASKSSPPAQSAESNTFHSAPQFETFSAI